MYIGRLRERDLEGERERETKRRESENDTGGERRTFAAVEKF